MSNIWNLDRMEEVAWRQKSRISWLKEGDKNTRFFHNMAKMRRRIDHIGNLRSSGRVIEKPEDIKEEIATFFDKLYRRNSFSRPKLDGVSFPSISAEDKSWLEKEFEVEEVESALAEYGSEKATGPNGFNFSFIKAGWDFLKKNFMDMLMEFHVRVRLNRAITATFLTLTSKVLNLLELGIIGLSV